MIKTSRSRRNWFICCLAPKAPSLLGGVLGVRLLLSLSLVLAAGRSEAALRIYYLRHAEGGHNVVKEWANVPKEQRPAYVGDPNMFTPKGETQVVLATQKLQRYHFDFIAVSPMWRTRHTILPYLRAVGAKGEIWPELHEFSGGSRILRSNLPAPADRVLNAGAPVHLPPDEVGSFVLRPGAMNDFKLPPGKGDDHDAAIRLVLQRVVDTIQQRFGGTDKSILLVGHGTSGKALLRMLTNRELTDLPAIANTGLWMVEEQASGRFKLKMFNDASYNEQAPSQPPALVPSR